MKGYVMRKKVVLNYTTGRSGTAYLSQVFGHHVWSKPHKGILRTVDDKRFVVVHERGLGVNVKRIILNGCTPDDARYELTNMMAQIDFVYPQFESFYNTNFLHGRYLSPALPLLDKPDALWDYRIIYVERKKQDVVKSFMRRQERPIFDKRRSATWIYILNQWDKPWVINKRTKDQWKKMTDKEKYEWYWDETQSQWNLLKIGLNQNKVLEIDFEEFAGKEDGIKMISDFIEMPYSREMIKIVANPKDIYN